VPTCFTISYQKLEHQFWLLLSSKHAAKGTFESIKEYFTRALFDVTDWIFEMFAFTSLEYFMHWYCAVLKCHSISLT